MSNRILELVKFIKNTPKSIDDEELTQYIETLLSYQDEGNYNVICDVVNNILIERALIKLAHSLEF
jgi:hypothetical protein